MRGILNINKPAGISSYDCLRQLKPVLKPKKIGHAGTLDPIATGVLLILLNEATKISRLLMGLPKDYEVEIRFGISTDTDDITGKPLQTTSIPDLSAAELQSILTQRFCGEITQVPPRFSALKMSGEPLYRLARRGIDFSPRARTITIYELKLLNWNPPFALVYAQVSGGTYIRALCRDIGQSLSSSATLNRLTRIRVGNFTIEQAQPLSKLLNDRVNLSELLVPIEQALDHLPRVSLSSQQAQALAQGRAISGLKLSGVNRILAQTDDKRFLALTRIESGRLIPERIIYAD
ncbi:MAG: tRNA pseudouridine(55) synthase TruB [bacterium]